MLIWYETFFIFGMHETYQIQVKCIHFRATRVLVILLFSCIIFQIQSPIRWYFTLRYDLIFFLLFFFLNFLCFLYLSLSFTHVNGLIIVEVYHKFIYFIHLSLWYRFSFLILIHLIVSIVNFQFTNQHFLFFWNLLCFPNLSKIGSFEILFH